MGKAGPALRKTAVGPIASDRDAAHVAEPEGCRVPDLRRVVDARRRDLEAVGAERHRDNARAVPAEGEELIAGGGVPDLEAPVVGGRDKAPVVGAEFGPRDPLVVPEEPMDRLARPG